MENFKSMHPQCQELHLLTGIFTLHLDIEPLVSAGGSPWRVTESTVIRSRNLTLSAQVLTESYVLNHISSPHAISSSWQMARNFASSTLQDPVRPWERQAFLAWEALGGFGSIPNHVQSPGQARRACPGNRRSFLTEGLLSTEPEGAVKEETRPLSLRSGPTWGQQKEKR